MANSKYDVKLGLIGSNIAHSESPSIFKKARPNWDYELIDVENFEDGYIRFITGDFNAVNVTAPFKIKAFEKAVHSDPLCEIIGASNLLIKEDSLIKAYNTDVLGATTCLKMALKSCYSDRKAEEVSVLILGLGGAGKAAAVASLMLGLKTTGLNRNTDISIAFKNRLQKGLSNDNKSGSTNKYIIEGLEIDDVNREDFSLRSIIENHDIIIYTLPIPLPFIEKIDFKKKVVIEANYHHPSFPLVPCKKYIGGYIWLHAQAQPLLSL